MKTDAVGRVRTPAAKRAEILAAFERSGVSGVEFAALVGVKYPTFAAWMQARRRQRGEAGTRRRSAVRFVEAAVPPTEAPAPLELELPGGIRLRLTEPAQVPLVVELLRRLRPC